jgi:hypothetical protein
MYGECVLPEFSSSTSWRLRSREWSDNAAFICTPEILRMDVPPPILVACEGELSSSQVQLSSPRRRRD